MRSRTKVFIATVLCGAGVLSAASMAGAQTTIRIMPADGAVFAVGQRFDIRVEATGANDLPPRGLVVTINGADVTARNVLDPGIGGERGAGGAGATSPTLPAEHRAAAAAPDTTNFLLRDYAVDAPGPVVVRARTDDGATAEARLAAEAWASSGAASGPRAKNIILLVGDGMGIAHRTAARLVSRGLHNGKAAGRLAMDTLDVTGLVMTASLNSAITDSSPGMSSYATGQKANNNQEGVLPDNTADVFDNPRVEYLGALLRRTRGPGFHVGIVSTADLTDSTPAANAVHTAHRFASPGIAAQFFDERQRNGVTVLLGGGARHFTKRADGRRLDDEFAAAGYRTLTTRQDLRALMAVEAEPPAALLGLFHPANLPVAFDKVGAGRYSRELEQPANAAYRDVPMLDEMAALAIRSLSAHAPDGFYLMIEGASIDKRAHAADAERTIWDVIEFDQAVRVALEFAAVTNGDADPGMTRWSLSRRITRPAAWPSLVWATSATRRKSSVGPCATMQPFSGSSRISSSSCSRTTWWMRRDFRSSPIRRARCCSAGLPRPIGMRTGCRIVSSRRRPSSIQAAPEAWPMRIATVTTRRVTTRR